MPNEREQPQSPGQTEDQRQWILVRSKSRHTQRNNVILPAIKYKGYNGCKCDNDNISNN